MSSMAHCPFGFNGQTNSPCDELNDHCSCGGAHQGRTATLLIYSVEPRQTKSVLLVFEPGKDLPIKPDWAAIAHGVYGLLGIDEKDVKKMKSSVGMRNIVSHNELVKEMRREHIDRCIIYNVHKRNSGGIIGPHYFYAD